MKRMLAMASVLAGVAGVACADAVHVQDLGTGGNAGQGVLVRLSNGLTFTDGSATKMVWAGQRSMLVEGVGADVFVLGLTGTRADAEFEVESVESALGEVKAEAIGRLLNSFDTSFANREDAAAFQAMLWEIVYDYDGTEESIDLTSGSVAFALVKQGRFNTFKENAMRGGGSDNLRVYTHEDGNDVLAIVPLPSSAGLAAFGLLTFGFGVRRRT